MKFKIVIVAFLLVLCGSVWAQKKVAVVKPYLEGNASAININIVKQTLVSTILKTEGYSAFSRNEIDAIFSEQQFQYGGDVNDATRKKLGDMYGADLLCISQIVGSGGELLMSAMLIDVQTAEILSSPDPIVVKATTQKVQESAKKLAEQLLNPMAISQDPIVAVDKPSKKEEPRQPEPKQPEPRQPEKPKVMYTGNVATDVSPTPLANMDNGSVLYVAISDENEKLNYDEAVSACRCKGDGWRLPTLDELKILERNKRNYNNLKSSYRYWAIDGDVTIDMGTGFKVTTKRSVRAKVRCVKEEKK